MEGTTTTLTQQQGHIIKVNKNDPVLLDEYNVEHKVVAYPSIGTAQSNEATVGVATTSSLLLSSPTTTSGHEKPRSQSTGRVRRSGRDLVQDVYERLGVERPAAGSTTTRGRCPGLRTAAEQQRARSLSRGRIRHRWPPSAAETARDEASALSKKQPTIRTTEPTPLSPKQQRGFRTRAAAVYRSSHSSRDDASFKETSASLNTNPTITKDLIINTKKSLSEWRRTLDKEAAFDIPEVTSSARNISSWEANTPRVANSSIIPKSSETRSGVPVHVQDLEWKDEKKEDSFDLDQMSPASVKERMLAFGGGNDLNHSRSVNSITSTRRSVDKQYAAQFATRDHPPKIDIFAESTRNGNQNGSSSVGIVEGTVPEDIKTKKPSAMDSDASLHSSSSVHSALPNSSSNNNNKIANIAEAFLAAIQSSSKEASFASPPRAHIRRHSYAPIAEIVSSDDPGNEAENVSLLSVTSEDPHIMLSPPSNTRTRSKSWNRVNAYTTTSLSLPQSPPIAVSSPSPQVARASINQTNNTTTSEVERLVEERVRIRVNELERHMLDQLQTFITRLDEKIDARVARLERSLHQALQQQR